MTGKWSDPEPYYLTERRTRSAEADWDSEYLPRTIEEFKLGIEPHEEEKLWKSVN